MATRKRSAKKKASVRSPAKKPKRKLPAKKSRKRVRAKKTSKRKAPAKKASKRKAPVKRKAPKRKAPVKRKVPKRKASKRKAPVKRKASSKRKTAAARLAKQRSNASKKGWETRRAREQARVVVDLRQRADLVRAKAERERLEADAERRSELIREAAERWEREQAEKQKAEKIRRAEERRTLRRFLRIEEKAAVPEEPATEDEMAELTTLMRDISYRFSPPIQVTFSAFRLSDGTVEARMRFSGFGSDWKGLLLQLSALFFEDIVPNYGLLKTWWVRIRLEVLDRETLFREVVRMPETPPTRKFGKVSRRVNVVRRLEKAAATFEAAISQAQIIEDTGGAEIAAIHLWFYKSRRKPRH